MSAITITKATDDEVHQIGSGLRAFNHESVGEIAYHPVLLAAKNDAGQVVGGFIGSVFLGWLSVDVLWVSESHRRAGIGRSLLNEAESEALTLGAKSAYLDTFQWQAYGFYAAQGYREFGRLNDFPEGQSRIFMQKQLPVEDPPPA